MEWQPIETYEGHDWLHLKRYGYAPGNYMNRCHACKVIFSDLDKRAMTCRPCAEKMHAERTPPPPKD